jgi:hypothetical protein
VQLHTSESTQNVWGGIRWQCIHSDKLQ